MVFYITVTPADQHLQFKPGLKYILETFQSTIKSPFQLIHFLLILAVDHAIFVFD